MGQRAVYCRQNNDPQIQTLTPRTCEYVTLHGKRDFADMIKVMEFEVGRLSWIIQMGPIKSQESLKVERLAQLWSQRDVRMERGSKKFMSAGFEDSERGVSQGMQTTSRSWKR